MLDYTLSHYLFIYSDPNLMLFLKRMLNLESELRLLTWLVIVLTIRPSLVEDDPTNRVFIRLLLESLQRKNTRRMIPILQLTKSRT